MIYSQVHLFKMYPFVHLVEYNTIVCSKCQHAVLATASAIHTHLSNGEKHIIPVDERRRIVQEIISIPSIRVEKEQFNPRVFPPPDNPPIPELGSPRRDGIKCVFEDGGGKPCGYITCQFPKIKEHCQVKHS